MNKKLWLLLLFSLGNISSLYSARGERKALEVNPVYMAFKQEVEIMRGYKYALRGAKTKGLMFLGLQVPVTAPKVVKSYLAVEAAKQTYAEKEEKYTERERRMALKKIDELNQNMQKSAFDFLMGSAQTAGLGAVAGATTSEIERRYILWGITNILRKNNTGYDFRKLPIDEAMMVLAAYQKNAYMMRKLKPFMQNFLEKPGVWQALAHLYFLKHSWWRPTFVNVGSVSSENVEKLKDMLE